MTSVLNADVKRMGNSVGRSTMGTAGRLLAATLGTVLAGTLLAVPPALAVPFTPQPLQIQVEKTDATAARSKRSARAAERPRTRSCPIRCGRPRHRHVLC